MRGSTVHVVLENAAGAHSTVINIITAYTILISIYSQALQDGPKMPLCRICGVFPSLSFLSYKYALYGIIYNMSAIQLFSIIYKSCTCTCSSSTRPYIVYN